MTMPRIRAAGMGWTKQISMTRRKQAVDSTGLVTYSDYNFTFRGAIQPLSPKEISLKPEGQRAWEWLQLHVFHGAPINTDDQIIYNKKLFKVMATNDYSQSGYIEYHLVRDYQNG